MELSQIESLISDSTTAESGRRQHAIELLDKLRSDPIRWSVGLQLFFDGSTPVSNFFGLSLIREYMSSNGGVPPVVERQKIREAMMSWLLSRSASLSGIESYVVNNIVTIVTLAVKHDFPELWPSAFSELLAFGGKGISELDIVIRILTELEVEVVMFNDARSKQEIVHNTIVKDAIRAGDIAGNIVQFLCQSAVSVRPIKASLSSRCLVALSEMVGWVDSGLILNQGTLSIIYQSLTDPDIAESGLTCLLELVKKGMDPCSKIQLVASINLIPMLGTVKIADPLSSAPHDPSTSAAMVGAIPAPRRTRGLSLVSDDESVDTRDEDITSELAAVLDVLLLELFGCWMKYEDSLITSLSSQPANESELQLIQLGPVIFSMLNGALPIAMKIFTVGHFCASETMVPSLNKFIGLLKQQQTRGDSIRKLLQGHVSSDKYFFASSYLSQFLAALYHQMQYPQNFHFDGDGDDEMAEFEAKKQFRKLFVNCCRVHPSECLQMVTAALSSLPQPLSQAPFPPLEALLRLLHAFAECGSYFSQMVSSNVFPQLVSALHSTDVSSHPHPQVKMAYFELCSRYAKITSPEDIQKIVSQMVGPSGLRHVNIQLRNRTAYLLLKLVEVLPSNVCQSLIPVVSSFSDLILLAPGSGALSMMSTGIGMTATVSQKDSVSLNRQSELYLLESVGIMTSSFDWTNSTGSEKGIPGSDHMSGESPTAQALASYAQHHGLMTGSNIDSGVLQSQVHLLAAMLDVLVSQLSLIANHPDLVRCAAELADIASHKLASIAALCRGHSYKKCPGTNPQFEQFQEAVVNIFCTSFGVVSSICRSALVQYKSLRDKGVVYYHRMLQVIGIKILETVRDNYLCFVSYADSSDIENTVQLANSLMVEFGASAVTFVDEVLGTTLDRIGYLYTDEGVLESTNAIMATQASIDRNCLNSETVVQASVPSLETTRIMLQRQYLGFLQHVAIYNCNNALTSARNVGRLDSIFSSVIQGLNGGGDGISAQGGIVLRRAALSFLAELVRHWTVLEDTDNCSPHINTKEGHEGASSGSLYPPPPHVSAALTKLLFEAVLPQTLTVCTGGSGLDIKGDVQSQGILVDTGALIFNLASRRPRDTREYFGRVLLPGLGWHVNAVTPMLTLLDTKVPSGTFKESFKKLIRQNLGASS